MAARGVAIVTGAAQGIGKGIALRLADDGFDVAINDLPRSKAKLELLSQEITAKGRKVFIVLGDVSVEADVEALVSTAVEKLGQLNVMVANAGICTPKSVLDTSAADWDHIFSINARGVFLCYKYAALQMIRQGNGGRIIGASSVAGQQGTELLGAYGATKFAVRGLTQTAALEFGRHGITVNAYCPGAIETDMLKDLGNAAGGFEKFYQDQTTKCAMGYNGTPAEIASIVSYLSSKEAHFITGQSLAVNGGRYFQ